METTIFNNIAKSALPAMALYCVTNSINLAKANLYDLTIAMKSNGEYSSDLKELYSAIDNGAEGQVSGILTFIKQQYLVS